MKRSGDENTTNPSPLQKKKKVTEHPQITTQQSNFDLSEQLMRANNLTNNLVNQLQTELSDLITKVSSKEIQLKQDEERLLREMEEKEKDKMKELSEREEQKISSSTSLSTRLGKNQVIKLNVGGKIFATNLQTITSVKETFFTGYFNDHFNPIPEEDGAFFIDRPFEQFHLILNYLRGIDIKSKLLDLNDSDLKDFIEEVVYYQITPIYEILPPKGIRFLKSKHGFAFKFDSNYCSSNLTLSNNDQRVKKTGEKKWNACVLGEEGNQFKVKLNLVFNNLLIGFAPRTANLNGSNCASCGYYLSIFNGALHSKKHLGTSYADSISTQSIIEVKLENGNILFIVDGEDKEIAFSNVPDEPKLYPAFEIYDNGSEIEV